MVAFAYVLSHLTELEDLGPVWHEAVVGGDQIVDFLEAIRRNCPTVKGLRLPEIKYVGMETD